MNVFHDDDGDHVNQLHGVHHAYQRVYHGDLYECHGDHWSSHDDHHENHVRSFYDRHVSHRGVALNVIHLSFCQQIWVF